MGARNRIVLTVFAMFMYPVLGVSCAGTSKSTEVAKWDIDQSKPPQPIAGASLYTPGEYLAWDVKWAFLSGGSAKLIVGEPGRQSGKKVLVIRSVIKTEGLVAVFKHLRDELITTIDIASGNPVSSFNAIESGKRRRSLEIAYISGKFSYEHREAGETQRGAKTVPPPSWVFDLHTTLAHVRAWEGEPSARGFFFTQSARTLFRVELGHVGIEDVDTPAGSFRSLRFDGVAQEIKSDGTEGARKRKLSMWISDDARRLPVKLVGETEYGDVYAILTEFRRPTGPAPTLVAALESATLLCSSLLGRASCAHRGKVFFSLCFGEGHPPG